MLKCFIRKSVHLPSGLEMSSENVTSLGAGSPDLVSFLSKYLAKQLKETHQRSIHTKCEAARNSTKALSIPIQKRTSEMIRDQYISQVHKLYKDQDRETFEEKTGGIRKRKRNPDLLKYRFGVHPTSSLSLEFLKPSLRGIF